MIDLYSAATPDGHTISIALEELQLPYKLNELDLQKNEQNEPWFLAINPNGRIPAIVDRDEENFAVFETGAILIYLAEKTGKLMPADRKGRSRVIQWLMFQVDGSGQSESNRLFRVLDGRLKNNEYLAGDYSIADIANWAWVRTHKWSGVTVDELPHLHRWMQAIKGRPGVLRGLLMPPSSHDLEADLGENLDKIANGAMPIPDRVRPAHH